MSSAATRLTSRPRANTRAGRGHRPFRLRKEGRQLHRGTGHCLRTVEQYYTQRASAPRWCWSARALTKHALNVHCGHDDVYGALDTGWIIVFGKDAQQAADQSIILRRVTELSLTPGMNVMDGFLTTHLERTFYKHEAALIREYLGAPGDIIDCPTESQRVLFGPRRRRVPKMIDLTNPVLLGPVQNQSTTCRACGAPDNFTRPILKFRKSVEGLGI